MPGAAFGLPELARGELGCAAAARAEGKAALVACAGCYPTATSPRAPPRRPWQAGWWTGRASWWWTRVSGVTGAGKKATERTHFCFATGNVEAYGVGTHRHTPEIEQILRIPGRVVFTPHLAPLGRGLLSTVTLPLAPDAPLPRVEDLVERYAAFYADDAFVQVLPAGTLPRTASVVGTNRAHVGVGVAEGARAIVAVGAIDNLGKGGGRTGRPMCQRGVRPSRDAWPRGRGHAGVGPEGSTLMTSSVFSGGVDAPGAPGTSDTPGAPAAAAVARGGRRESARPAARRRRRSRGGLPLHAASRRGGGQRPRVLGGGRARGLPQGARPAGLGRVAADEPCACAAVFTRNAFCAAPVRVSRAHLSEGGATPEGGPAWGTARGVVVNSGNANAATGERGLEAARATARMAARALGCEEREVLVASTGVIGQHLPLAPFEDGLPAAVAALSKEGGASAARAVMTTDTRPKEAACTFSVEDAAYAGCTFTVGGMAKGSGMIMPDMATMIAVLTTDAPVSAPGRARGAFRRCGAHVQQGDGGLRHVHQHSCFLFASGAAAPGLPAFPRKGAAFRAFAEALEHVCTRLARAMAADGEGASRLVTVRVTGAATPADADAAARAVANSPLVKTAVNGHDANWGRIVAAVGKSGASFRQEDVAVDIMGLPVCRGGCAVPFDEGEALARFERPEVGIDVHLGAGDAQATVWTCDLTHEYITINGDYRT